MNKKWEEQKKMRAKTWQEIEDEMQKKELDDDIVNFMEWVERVRQEVEEMPDDEAA